MSCPQGKVLNPLYGDVTGECINGAQGLLDNVIDAGTRLNAMAPKVVGKLVFATFNMYKGKFGGLAGADSIRNEHPNAARFDGWCRAWLLDGRINPNNSFNQFYIRYVRTNGVHAAPDFEELLEGGLDAAFDQDVFGLQLDSQWSVWTATKENRKSQGKHGKKWVRSDNADGFRGSSALNFFMEEQWGLFLHQRIRTVLGTTI